ncbi:PP2C family protein-serine/threonine phosphatase [Streptomyces endophytica]|uniref:Serine/threonine-protein phosphatase n=1 Tax=Streptomyces endophytica TaxID=2991496 RepID=A0ABY6PH19_9ACTN|nr:PP2C family protein-serine/threonine phosphatase [Streptomyces endophytica]UZJ33111.1 serine/threonine-protein phosphatase [Streptomyces endophytica]
MRLRHGPAQRAGFRRWSPGLLVVPLAIIVAVTVVDINSPTSIHLGPFLVAAPAITASFAGAGLTGAVGALAVAAQVIIGTLHGGLMTPNHQAQVAALLVISVLVTVFRYVQDRHQRRLSRVQSVAVAAQQVLMRPLPERIGPLRIAATYLAADAEALIGGDLYAVAPTPGATRLVVGDVRGKGLSAIGEAAVLIGAFQGSAYRNLSLPGIAAHLGNSVHWNTAHRTAGDPEPTESFVTAVVLDVHHDEPFLTMVNCGHPPPLLLRAGEVRPLEVRDPALPLGIGAPSEGDYQVETFDFAPGDLLLLYTDGAIEARDATGAFYRLPDRLAGCPERDPGALVARLRDDLLGYVGGTLGDDVALIALTRTDGPEPRADRR